MSFKTDKGRVIGLGSAKHGTGHFWVQRITAVALVPLFLLAILPLDWSLGASHADVMATYSNPFNAVILILFIAVLFLLYIELLLQLINLGLFLLLWLLRAVIAFLITFLQVLR